MNDFENDDLYELTAEESRQNARSMVRWLLYLVLAAVVIITGAHAVMLVLSQTAAYETGQTGLVAGILTAIRVAFPLIVEAAAVVAGIGFIQSRWRRGQKTVGLGIELTWLLFAAVNMITFFTIERGNPLQNWQAAWVQYGLPLSALVAGALTYLLVRADPDHKRDEEHTAARERVQGVRFKARQRALLSPAMARIEAQRAWMDAIKELRAAGYTERQIAFMTQYTPDLLMDNDANGRPDIMDAIEPRPAGPQVLPPAAPPSLTDRARAAMGISTHETPRQDEPPTAAGQGERTPVYASLAHLLPEELRRMAAELEAERPTSASPNGREENGVRP